MHPRVMAERAAVIECRQELLWENDYNGRGLILDRERAVCGGIESTMSREPLAKLLGCGSAQSSDSQGEHPIVLDFDCVFWS